MRVRIAFLLVLVSPSAARAATRDQVAQHYAPVIYQETNDSVKDLFTAFDFDGDWNGDNQAENMECWSDSTKCNTADNPNSACAGQKCPLVATVYYTVIETPTHWFVQYMPYHPLDWKVTNGHENDTESILITVNKAGGPLGVLQAMETRFHDVWYQYSNDPAIGTAGDNVDGPVHFTPGGRPAVYSQMVGHGICGGFSPPNFAFPDLQLTCNHSDTPHIDTQGVIYSPDLAAAMPVVVSGSTVNAGYTLVELLNSVWPHIHDIGAGKTFQAAIDYNGERCAMFTCPKQFGGNWEGNEGVSPGEPWAQVGGNGVSADGDQFFDPAFTMSKRLAFPMPFSLTYCFNPYLGIADTCGDTADDGGVEIPDAGVGDLSGEPADASRFPGGDGPTGPGGHSSSGCGCRIGASAADSSTGALLILGGALLAISAATRASRRRGARAGLREARSSRTAPR
ncbi:MAG TPA: hypothetical protein VFF06_13765 [Polyangia bacterium]|nr:hypothetical protein [Polyangia bacterium]